MHLKTQVSHCEISSEKNAKKGMINLWVNLKTDRDFTLFLIVGLFTGIASGINFLTVIYMWSIFILVNILTLGGNHEKYSVSQFSKTRL